MRELAFGTILRWTGPEHMEVMVLGQVGVAGCHVVMVHGASWYWYKEGHSFFLALGALLSPDPIWWQGESWEPVDALR